VIEAFLAAGVSACEAFTDLDEPLFPEEAAAIASAVPKRQREFRTVRGCARAALAGLGLDRPPMVPGERGAPSWPAGVVGSMTHCAGYAAAAVAPTHLFAGLGIDAEPHAPLPAGVLDVVTCASEREHLIELAGTHPDVYWDRVLFSAKESVYKTWFPLTRSWLDFEDVAVTIDPAGGTFGARLLVTGPVLDARPLTGFDGRWLVRNGLVLVVTTLAAPGDRPQLP
jgi:4'-phosphopantetheinyl transferase EntD